MKKYRVLSIDAWADGDSWSWNNWFHVSNYNESTYGPLTDQSAKQFFRDFAGADFRQCELDDDQYNLVLVKKKNKMPLLAIEYGANL